MEFEEFDAQYEAVRALYQDKFSADVKLFDSWHATETDLARAEQLLGTRFPDKYKTFMRRYGGGQFLFMDILPVISSTEEDLLAVNRVDNPERNFISIAPVGTGDWWGFVSSNGICETRVSFLDHEDGSIRVEASDFLEFVAIKGLRVQNRT